MTKQGQAELLASVIMSVQEVLSSQGQQKKREMVQSMMSPPQFQTSTKKASVKKVSTKETVKKEIKTVFVQDPFYMKNGEEQMPMITQGAARNVPVSLRIVKRVGDKAITLERYRARMTEYINIRPVIKKGQVEILGLREVENRSFETTNEAAKIIMEIMKGL